MEQLCGTLTNRSGPFAECHWTEAPAFYMRACVFDLCQYGTGNRMFCAALESYAQLCSLRSIRLPEWRTSLGCSKYPLSLDLAGVIPALAPGDPSSSCQRDPNPVRIPLSPLPVSMPLILTLITDH